MKQGFWTKMAACALAAALAGCAESESDSDAAASRAIGFGVATESRAAINSAADMDEFNVWAYHHDEGSGSKVVFNDTRVYRNSGGWTYDDLQPWEVGDYVFGAFYPTELDGLHDVQMWDPLKEEKKKGVYVDYFDGEAGDVDLMTAFYERTFDGTNSEPVVLSFGHILSKVSVAAKAVGMVSDVTVTSVEFTGMVVTGDYNYDQEGAWRLIRPGDSELEGKAGKEGTFSKSGVSLPASGESVDLLTDLLLIPQEVTANFKVTVSYTADGEPRTETATLPAQPAWEEGKAYRYTLTVTPKENLKLVVSVLEWTDADDVSVSW